MTNYSQADVERILTRALTQRASQSQRFSLNDLNAMAAELGIAPEVLSQAMAAESQANSRIVSPALPQRERWVSLRQRGIQYLMIATFVLLLNGILSGRITWAVFPVLGLGLSWGLQAAAPETLSWGCAKASRSSAEKGHPPV